MPMILKCIPCGALFDRDTYPRCPHCGSTQAQPAFTVSYAGTGFNPYGTQQAQQPFVEEMDEDDDMVEEPPRRAPPYEHQLVIAVLTGSGDAAIETIAQNLQRKHADISSLVYVRLQQGNMFDATTHELKEVSVSTRERIQNATKPENQTENAATVEKVFRLNTSKSRCRLYLTAHGDDGFNFAGRPGDAMAVFVARAPLLLGQVTRISVVSCYGAGFIPSLYDSGRSPQENQRVLEEAKRADMDKNSFAAVFHRKLGEYGLRTEVMARRANVNTNSKTLRKGTRFDSGYSKVDELAHKAPWSKFRFYWEGEEQRVAPVYSDGDTRAWPQPLK
jgi:hypothetical protein